MKLSAGQKLTIISISDWMAHTQKSEVQVVSLLDNPEERRSYQNGPIAAHRVGTMKPRGRRKQYFLDIKADSSACLVFDGWDLPIKTDSEVLNGSFSGNACYNLGGMTPGELQDFIETRNLNGPTSDAIKGICLYVAPGSSVTADGELLWPKINVSHAVINRMKEKVGV